MSQLDDQIDNDNEFGLGHWTETDTQFSDTCHVIHTPITTATPPPFNISATAPMETDTSGLEYIGATVTIMALDFHRLSFSII